MSACHSFLFVRHMQHNFVWCQARASVWNDVLIQIKKRCFFRVFFRLFLGILGYQFLSLTYSAAVQWESIRMGIHNVNYFCHKNKCSSKWGFCWFVIQVSKLVHYFGCAVVQLFKIPYLHKKFANLDTHSWFFYLVPKTSVIII